MLYCINLHIGAGGRAAVAAPAAAFAGFLSTMELYIIDTDFVIY